jgi:hypothetical protein
MDMDFNADAIGAPPDAWTCGMTGRGRARWIYGP